MTTQPLSAVQNVPTTRHKNMLALSFIAFSALAIHRAHAQEATYIIFNAPGSTFTRPKSINLEGAITGTYSDGQYNHGFLRAPDGSFTTFDPPGSAYTFPASMNRVGAIAGAYTDAQFVGHGFLRSPDGSFTTLDPPGSKSDPGGPGTGASAMNGAGEITGSYEHSTAGGSIAIHGFLRSRAGKYTTFHVPGAPVTAPTGINAEGAIVGTYSDGQYTHGFLRAPGGKLTTFDVAGPTTYVSWVGINRAGEVAGSYEDAGSVSHGFLRARDGTFTTFDVPGDAFVGTVPTSINSKGEITGWFEDTNGAAHGFVRAPNGTFTIFDPPGHTGTDPTGINFAGTIIGVVNCGHGFIRTENKKDEDQHRNRD